MSETLPTISFDFCQEGTLSRSDAPGRAPLPTQGYFLDDRHLNEGLSSEIDPLFADWLEIAHAIYLADRLVRRPVSYERGSASWARRLHLRVPVRVFEFWAEEKMTTLLTEILSFLTEDVWSFEFCPGKLPRRSEGQQQFLFKNVSGPAEVALLSAGLDSFAGAAIRRQARPDEHFVFVSGATSPTLRSRQSEQFRYLRGSKPHLATHIALEHNLRQPPDRMDLESSQRSRGFLHLTLGCITALTVGARQLHVYENGVGAINLPLDGSQIGALNSRPVNPITLLRMSQLAQRIGGRGGFHIVNPFLFQTKGQMCEAVPVQNAAAILRRTISCDRPTRRTGRIQCGTCSSCVLRRLSLYAAGLHHADPGHEYDADLFEPDPALSKRRWLAFEKMHWQAGVIERALATPNPWSTLAEKFWMLPRVASEVELSEERADMETNLVSLYRRYVDEWRAFPVQRVVTAEPLAA
jgi:hypothetical protein